MARNVLSGAIRPRMTPLVARPAGALPPEDPLHLREPSRGCSPGEPGQPERLHRAERAGALQAVSAAVIAPQARILKVKS